VGPTCPVVDNQADCLAVDEINLQALFKRAAAVVHHGGAGTTTIAALAGAPQVAVPQIYDQHYWARQVERLGIGAAHAAGSPTTESLTTALVRALHPDVVAGARSVASTGRADGAQGAAEP
jgi:vancomycin aglycone glucosyltransferase